MLHKQTVSATALELLKSLMALPELNNFALVGGTNLALRYGHRISVDLDLFTEVAFDSNDILPALINFYPSISIGTQKTTSLQCWVEEVKIDIVLHQYPYINPIEIIDGIRFVSVPDIIAMKLNAVSQRGAKKDFWDIALLLDEYTLADMLDFFRKRYAMFDVFHIIRSLTFFEDAEKTRAEIVSPLRNTTWEEVKRKVAFSVKGYLKDI